jgi:phospholipid/cholesterol/gamma-HCH transport system substrate-binding protein
MRRPSTLGAVRVPIAAVAVIAVAVLAGGLAGCGGGPDGYVVQASFPRAVALYEQSAVKVMGIDVGTVTRVRVMDDHVEIEMVIDDDVPLPLDVEASIVPLSLIGERNVVLSPPWRPGDERIVDGYRIPAEHTHVPIEPDEALQAITDLAEAIDPAAVRALVTNGAAALDGHGADLNRALRETADLTTLLATQDDALIAVAEDVHRLAGVLRTRQEVLGRLIDEFATVTGVLADEREAIAAFLDGLARLTEEGNALLTRYEVQLPQDLGSLARVALTIQANADSVQQLLNALDGIGTGVVGAYDPETGGVRLRFSGSPTVVLALEPILELLGLGPLPCIPLPIGDTTCVG